MFLSVDRTKKSHPGRRLRATRFLVRSNLAIIGQTITGRAWRAGRGEGHAGRSMADVVRARLDDPDHRRRRIARAKERRAFLVLGIVMASFVGCWLPFFFVYLVTSSRPPTAITCCLVITTPGQIFLPFDVIAHQIIHGHQIKSNISSLFPRYHGLAL